MEDKTRNWANKRDVIRILIWTCVFSLPFTKAMTIDVKFPLKIYEIAILFAGILIFLRFKVYVPPRMKKILYIVMGFWTVTSLLFILRLLFPIEGMTLTGFTYRFGPAGDGITKLCYLLLAIYGFVLISLYSFRNQRSVLAAWLAGAVVASLYSWYLSITSFLGMDYILLPGIDSTQRVTFGSYSFIRSGTFEEGNFLGLYLLVSTSLALYAKRLKTALLLSLTVLVSASSINLVALSLFWGLYAWHKFKLRRSLMQFSKKNLILKISLIPLIICVFYLLLSSGYIIEILAKKLPDMTAIQRVLSLKLSEIMSYSLGDRINQIYAGILMFKDHPFIGVGISQYGYYYNHYSPFDLIFIHYGKVIPNNIYIELLSELGILGFSFFVALIFKLYKLLKLSDLKPLKYGFIATIFVLNAFPTYSVMFLWAFFGFIYGVVVKHRYSQFQILPRTSNISADHKLCFGS